MLEVLISLVCIVGFASLLLWIGDIKAKRRRQKKSVFLINSLLYGLPMILILYSIVIYSIENDFQWQNLLPLILIPLFIVGATVWVILLWLAPDIINVIWKSIAEKLTKNS